MALNGSVSVEATRGGNDDLVFSWEAVQDQSTMTSTISWKLELVAYAYGRIEQSTPQPWTVTIDGQEFSGTASVNIANNETKQLAAGEIVLTHNEDGTRSFAFTFSQELNITWGASSGNPIYIGAVTGEGTGELDPLEAPEPEPQKFPIKKWLAGLIAALCSPRRAFPQREPIGYLYGHIAKDGEKTHTINGVDYYGYVVPKFPELDENVYKCAIMFERSAGLFDGCSLFVFSEQYSCVNQNPKMEVYAPLKMWQIQEDWQTSGAMWEPFGLETEESGIHQINYYGLSKPIWSNYVIRRDPPDDELYGSIVLDSNDCVIIPIYE